MNMHLDSFGRYFRHALVATGAVLLVLLLSSVTTFADEREPQEHPFSLTCNDENAFEGAFGAPLTTPQITDPSGEARSISGEWQHYENGEWKSTGSSYFFAGFWRYYIAIELDEEATLEDGTNPKYDFYDDYFTVTVNGSEWETIIEYDDESGECSLSAAMLWDDALMIEAEDGGDLIFVDSPDYDIPKSYPGEGIWPFSVANYVSGGSSPYTFSKSSGPGWLEINSESGEVTGTPMELGQNDPLVITVTDAANASKSITIDVAETGREIINRVRAEGYEPALFEPVDMFLTVFSDDSPGELITDEGTWQKKNGSEWKDVSNGDFCAGTWRYTCPLRVHDNHYVLDEHATVTVNNKEWETSNYVNEPDSEDPSIILSQLTATSPEFEFEQIPFIVDGDQNRQIKITYGNQTYTGHEITTVPKVVYSYGDEDDPVEKTLEEGKDFTLEFSNNLNVSTDTNLASVAITGAGDFTGTINYNFRITPADISGLNVVIDDQIYTGEPLEPSPEVKMNDIVLEKGTDYDLSFANNVNIGEATCTITGKGNCTGTLQVKFRIAGDPCVKGHTWRHVKHAGGLLKDGSEYDECTVCGTKQNVKAIKGYAAYYVKALKVKKGKKAITVKWKKQSKKNRKKYNGYQIRYSTKADMSNAKYAKAGKSSKSKKIKKLAKKTKYYVQVRTYTKKGGTIYYSKWSAKKKVKTK